ncbi:MAG: protein-arginine deiminase family protein [Pirellulales bacterium]
METTFAASVSYFDTDGDLLGDGWETGYGLNPLSADQNSNGITDCDDDFDGDGLNNLAEFNHHTDPTNADTDGDGASDSTETTQGSNPLNPSDGGQPPASDMKARFILTVGDPLGSQGSERWAIHVGDIQHTAPGFGDVDSGGYDFEAGQSYNITLEHLGTRPEFLADNWGIPWGITGPNYNWTASIEGTTLPYWIYDPDYTAPLIDTPWGTTEGGDQYHLLQIHHWGVLGEPNLTADKVARLHIPKLDADVDSKNDSGFVAPEDNADEDRIEQDSSTGKIIFTSSGDIDNDGIVDSQDMCIPGGHFVPMVLRLSKNIDEAQPTQIDISMYYNDSQLRIWKPGKDAPSSRTTGDIIANSTAISASSLGLSPGGSVVVFIEALDAGDSLPLNIIVSAAVTGTKDTGCGDTVHVIPTTPIDLHIDSDNNDGYLMPEPTYCEEQVEDVSGDPDKPGKLIAVNDNDDDNDLIPDFADGFGKFGIDGDDVWTPGENFVPLVLELPEHVDLATASLRISYDASDPEGVTRTGAGTEADPYVYSPASGTLRIWTKEGGLPRSGLSVKTDSLHHYVPPDTYDDLSRFDVDARRTVTLYVEAVARSAAYADQRIVVEFDPDGSGPVGFVSMDAVRVTAIGVDLDIDSDNNHGFDIPAIPGSPYEDAIEAKIADRAKPGKVLVANDNDDDNDGIPDFADGFGKYGGTSNETPGERFVPLVLELPEPLDPTKATVEFIYDFSDPAQVTRTGTGTPADPYIYAPAQIGVLRIWTDWTGNGTERKMAPVNAEASEDRGNYVPGYVRIAASQLGFTAAKRTVTLFVEAIRESGTVASDEIRVVVDPDGDGPLGNAAVDEVRVTRVRVSILADTDRDGTVDLQRDLAGKAAWTNDRGAIFSVNCDRDGSHTNSDGNPLPDAIYVNDAGEPEYEDFVIENVVIPSAIDAQDIAPIVIPGIGVIPTGFKVFLKTNELEDVQRTHLYKAIGPGSDNKAFWGGAKATATSGADASGGPTIAAETRTEIDITRWVDWESAYFQGVSGVVTLGLEGLMFRFLGANAPSKLTFDGEVDFTLELRKDATVIASSDVRLKVAPWMMLSRDRDSEEVWAETDPQNAAFLADLNSDSAGQLRTVPIESAGSQWLQDHVEIGYTQRPGGSATHIVFQLPYGDPNPTWPLTYLLSGNVGVFQLGASLGGRGGDHGGNLEVLPPSGTYPLGRIVMGNTVSNTLKDFLISQEVQAPVFDAPTKWLRVGHIDEVTSFLAGGTVAIADPTLAWNLLSDTTRVPADRRHEAVFFNTGATAPKGGTVGGATPNRLYDGPATGSITVVGGILDGETVSVSDGTSTKVFEFDTFGGVAAGNVAVDLSAAVSAQEVRDALIAAINGISGFNVKSVANGPETVHLWNQTKGVIGNQAITETVAHAGFSVVGMAGGKNDGRDFTTENWSYVRTFTYTNGKPDQGQVAHIKPGGAHDGWIEIDEVWNTTSKLVPGSGASQHIFGYTRSPRPNRIGLGPAPHRTLGGWFNLPGGGPTPDKYVVVEDTQVWATGTPAIVTVEEVLADADFEAVNKTHAQGQIDLVKAALDAAMAGLQYKSLPALFFGDATGDFANGETAVAFNPGPTNLQTVNGHYYVPKQFGPLDQMGTDPFAEAIDDVLGAADVRWVDDWEWYHALSGEVHCGTVVKHSLLLLDWWWNQL